MNYKIGQVVKHHYFNNNKDIAYLQLLYTVPGASYFRQAWMTWDIQGGYKVIVSTLGDPYYVTEVING